MLFIAIPNAPPAARHRTGWMPTASPIPLRDIKTDRPSAEELRTWQIRSGLPLRRFFNTSGLLYKSLGLKDKLPTMDESAQLELLASDGMLVRRPLLVGESTVLVGFRQAEWEQSLL